MVQRAPEAPAEAESGHLISAPMIGTFYASPSPGAPPFVQRGDQVFAGQTIGIIEAMKIMNEISADRAGMVLDVLVENGEPVEYGSPLIRLGAGRDARS
jgi:acetyl-CoA carboxylase biotin carboxyl carrier protein